MKKTIFILLLLILISSLYAADWKELIRQYGPSVCLIEIINKGNVQVSGSGFVFSEKGEILTNAHVVKSAYFNDDYEIRVQFGLAENKEKYYPASITVYSKELDIAVLSSNIENSFPCVLGDSNNLELMDDILVLGYPLGKSVKSTPGYIQAFQEMEGIGKMLDLSADVDPGNSGGPVFSSNGEVIGIVTAEIFGFNFNLAMPITLVKNYLKAQEEGQIVRIITYPDSCRIFVNNQFKGKSPIDLDFFGAAQELQIEKDGFISQKFSLNQKEVNKGEIKITLEAIPKTTSLVKINTIPKGALVFIDNEKIGTTPLELELEKDSKYRIRIIKSFYKEFFKELLIGNNDDYNFEFKL
ncbi:MAG: trypsin-like peptidase domain-containing protein [Spirochaetales bacterium]|nr:trypsin-like peptidase domain-containing protein [Spirochaetales bacterium]